MTDLVVSLLPPAEKGLPPVDGLHYQLLTAAAGTLAYAAEHEAACAVLVIHESRTAETRKDKHDLNASAYRDFIRRLRGEPLLDQELDGLTGPFRVPGPPLFPEPPPLLIGKVTTDLRSAR